MFSSPTCIRDYDFHSLALLNFFLSSDASIFFSAMTHTLLGDFDHIVVLVSIDFPSISKGDIRLFS